MDFYPNWPSTDLLITTSGISLKSGHFLPEAYSGITTSFEHFYPDEDQVFGGISGGPSTS